MRAEIQWRRLDQPAVERATIFSTKRAQILEGLVDGTTKDGRSYNLRYTLRCAGDWTTRYAMVDGSIDQSPIKIIVSRNAVTGAWMRDGVPQRQIARCVDIDLGFSPITNTLPIRRLGLGIGQGAAVRAAWLQFPDFELEVLDQRYERVGRWAYIYESDGGRFRADLEVDGMGIVTRYDRYWVGCATILGNRRSL
jgi:hypothetical protein